MQLKYVDIQKRNTHFLDYYKKGRVKNSFEKFETQPWLLLIHM